MYSVAMLSGLSMVDKYCLSFEKFYHRYWVINSISIATAIPLHIICLVLNSKVKSKHIIHVAHSLLLFIGYKIYECDIIIIFNGFLTYLISRNYMLNGCLYVRSVRWHYFYAAIFSKIKILQNKMRILYWFHEPNPKNAISFKFKKIYDFFVFLINQIFTENRYNSDVFTERKERRIISMIIASYYWFNVIFSFLSFFFNNYWFYYSKSA